MEGLRNWREGMEGAGEERERELVGEEVSDGVPSLGS